jgi:hypothetical protein
MNAVNESERKEIEELLPWHAAGTLNRRDSQLVEAALASDAELKRRFELVREELGETIHLNETLGAPSSRVMESLFAKIEAEPTRGPAIASGVGARIGEFFAGLTPRRLAWAAAAVVILLQAGLIADVVIKDRGTGGYQTASAPGATKGEGPYALVRFQPQASAADVTKFLETNKLSLVGGPTTGGLYKVQLAPTALPKDQLAALIKKLQVDKVVGFIATSE